MLVSGQFSGRADKATVNRAQPERHGSEIRTWPMGYFSSRKSRSVSGDVRVTSDVAITTGRDSHTRWTCRDCLMGFSRDAGCSRAPVCA